MRSSRLDAVAVAAVLLLCLLGTLGGYLIARSREDDQREQYLNVAAQVVFEGISTQLLRTSESLHMTARLMAEQRLSEQWVARVAAESVPHLVDAPGAVRRVARNALGDVSAIDQQMLGDVQLHADASQQPEFELLTPIRTPQAIAQAPERPPVSAYLLARISVVSLLTEAAYRAEAQLFEMEVLDRKDGQARTLFRTAPYRHVADERWAIRSKLDVFGHPWEVVLRPMAAPARAGSAPQLALGAGIVLTGMLMLLFQSATRARRRIAQAEDREREERVRREQEALSRQLSERIAQIDRTRGVGEMAFVIGHELSQPLTAIRSYAELGESLSGGDGPPPPQLHGLFEKISRSAARAHALLEQVRNYVRGTPAVNIGLDFRKVAAEVVDLLDSEARRLQVQVRLDLGRDMPAKAMGDPLQLSQVLVNVIRNAVEAAAVSRQRDVAIQLLRHGQTLELQVRDSGPGFSAEALAQAGTPFFTTKPSGLGLGLVIARNILKAHGGDLKLSNADGRGAQVSITLPTSA